MKALPFITKISLSTSILLLLEFICSQLGLFAVPMAMYIMTFAFGVVSLMIYRVLSKSNKKNPKRFITNFMGALGIKLFASLIFITVYLFFSAQEYKVPMALGMFVIYSVCNVLILRQLTSEIQAEPKSNSTNQ